MSRELPSHPQLAHLRKQARRLLRDCLAGKSEAVSALMPATSGGSTPKLADAQHVVAREYGFASWALLKQHVESLTSSDAMAALSAAVRLNDAERVRDVLVRFPGLRHRLDEAMPDSDFGATALITAAKQRNREMVDALLDAGASINQRSHWWAGGFGVLGDDADLNAHLIARGADVDAYEAARMGLVDQLRTLVAADPSVVHARFGDGQTALHVASSVEIAASLLDNGADVNARDIDHESTPAQYLIRKHPEVVRFLLSRGARPDILMACALGNVQLVRNFLDKEPGAIWTTVSPRFFPMEHARAGGSIYIWTLGNLKGAHAIAQEFGHGDVLALLRSRTPDSLALSLACENGDAAEVARLRTRVPASQIQAARELISRLPAVANTGNTHAVRLMLESGWPANAKNDNDETALHWSAFHGNIDMVRELIARGADANVKERTFSGSPLGWAEYGKDNSWMRAQGDYPAVIDALVSAGGR